VAYNPLGSQDGGAQARIAQPGTPRKEDAARHTRRAAEFGEPAAPKAPPPQAAEPTGRQRGGRVSEVTSDSFDHVVLQSDVPVLVDFYADWCGPCRALAPTLVELAREVPDVRVVKVNIDESPDLAARYQVSSIPSLRVFQGGGVTARHLGSASKERLKALLDQ
jgi:thioredoxin 1